MLLQQQHATRPSRCCPALAPPLSGRRLAVVPRRAAAASLRQQQHLVPARPLTVARAQAPQGAAAAAAAGIARRRHAPGSAAVTARQPRSRCSTTPLAAFAPHAAAATTTTTTSSSSSSKFRRSLWTAIDVAALLGSVGGALAALLGVVSPTYALTLPLVLPVVSLVAALQREDLATEEGREYLSQLRSSFGGQGDTTTLLRDAAAAIEEVRREVRAQAGASERLAVLEDKLAVLEGAVVAAARNSREAAAGIAGLSQALTSSQALSQQQLGPDAAAAAAQLLAGSAAAEVLPLLRAELAASVGPWLGDTANAVKRLDTRLGAVEGSLAGLEVSQSDGLLRLGSSISSSLLDAESTLQSSVRLELAAAVEPLKQLVAAAAAAQAAAGEQQQLPALLLDADAQLEVSPTDADGSGALEVGGSSRGWARSEAQRQQLLRELRDLVAAEVSAAAQQILAQQAEVQAVLSQPPRPALLADEQWEALGRRLARLERLLQSVPELGEQAVAAQLAPILSAQQAATQAQEALLARVANAGVDGNGAAAAMLPEQQQQVLARLAQLQDSLQQGAAVSGGVSEAALSAAVQAATGALQQDLSAAVYDLRQDLFQQQQQAMVPAAAELQQLQQQLQQVGGALAQLQDRLPLQLSALPSTVSSGGGDGGYDGSSGDGLFNVGYPDPGAAHSMEEGDDSSSSSSSSTAASAAAAAAAAATAAAAQGLSEVKQLLFELQSTSFDLQAQVGTLAAQLVAQQAAASSSWQQEQQDVQQQAAVQAGADVQAQLYAFGEGLQQQLSGLQQELAAAADAARSATAQATAAAQEAAAAASAAAAAASQLQQQGQQQQEAASSAAMYAAQLAGGGWGSYQEQPQPQLEPQQPAYAGATWAAAPEPAAAALPEAQAQPAAAAQWPVEQQLQQQPGAPATGTSSASMQPSLQLPDVGALSEEGLRTEGLRLLRTGREAARGTGAYAASGPDFAAAEALLQGAVACFGAAVDSEPQDTRALGNLGNALLAQGELKRALLDELRLALVSQAGSSGRSSSPEAEARLRGAEARLRSEAAGLLTRAGEIFRRVLEVAGWSSRALVNWGKALVGRAELASEASAAAKLYNAAIDKYEAVLEEDPGMLVAKYRCALAMQGLAGIQDPAQQPSGDSGAAASPRQRLTLLSDAAGYLSDVVAARAGGDVILLEAATAALRTAQEQLEVARLQAASR